jgi:hypothetical protein
MKKRFDILPYVLPTMVGVTIWMVIVIISTVAQPSLYLTYTLGLAIVAFVYMTNTLWSLEVDCSDPDWPILCRLQIHNYDVRETSRSAGFLAGNIIEYKCKRCGYYKTGQTGLGT